MRKTLLLVLIGAALSGCGVPSTAATPTAPPSYRASVLADHPVAYWRLSQATGALLADASGNVNDCAYAAAVTLRHPCALARERHPASRFDPTGSAPSGASPTSLHAKPTTT